jgi:two-component system CheB/CheR fusion protein
VGDTSSQLACGRELFVRKRPVSEEEMTIPVVGIGASAGGLEAFSALLAHLPATTGLAFVFVQHLDPKHHSNLTEILVKVSAIPVQQAADGIEIEPNHLYVIPPDAGLEIAGRVLRITPRAPTHSVPHMPIDHFLRSLAEECGSGAIGVILSGAGTDGAAGLQAVKVAGGVTFAQDSTTAKFASMPEAAIGSGCVDLVLSPEAIAAALTKLGRHPYVARDEIVGSSRSNAAPDQYGPILKLLREATGVDFALYRENMIRRRILRRLALHDVDSLAEYVKQIENDPRELSALQQDLLINVTRFFRDPQSFVHLQNLVFPRLVQHRPADAAIRIWVPGCATGEEAYSIAISLREYFEETGQFYPVQIVASDVSSAAIDKARRGKYAETIAADISPERLNRYFSKVEGGYQIGKALREMCVFSKHDLIQDPPFSKLDLISCRNVLIFFGSVRKSVIAVFHYALKPDGFLVLGPSEAESGSLFSIVPGAQSIYTRNATLGKQHPLYAGAAGARRRADVYRGAAGAPADKLARDTGLREQLERALLARYSGAGVVVDASLEVLEVLGQTVPYLALPPGKVSLSLLNLIPETRLFLEVERLVREVQVHGEPAREDRVPHGAGGAAGAVNVEVIPLGGVATDALLVLFEPAPQVSQVESAPTLNPRDREIAILKQDLADARQRLLSRIAEHQSSEDESQNATEEAISANEELQTLNEELETTKEELQSTNEELTTVNEELRSKNIALNEANDFAMLIIETAAAPLLVLDTELRIKTANRSFYRAFRMSPHEAEGQLLYAISNGCWDIPRLRETLEAVLPDHKWVRDFEIEQDFPGIGHRVLVLNARQLDGLQQILLGIDDVTERKERSDAMLLESEHRFRNIADTAPVMIWVSGPDKGCTFFNKGWLDFTGRAMQKEIGNGWAENVHPEDLDRCWIVYSTSFDARRTFQMEYRLRRADGEYRWLLDIGVPRFEPRDVFAGYVGSCIDITEVKRAHEENLAKRKLESVGTMAGGVAHDFNNLLGAILAHSELALAELASGSRPEAELLSIRASSIRGAEIVRQLMIYAGQEGELVELMDLSGIVKDMLDLLSVSVSKRVRVETYLGQDLPRVRANPGHLEQVAMNLITNASEAIGDREGVIRVTTDRLTLGRDSSVAAAENLAEGDYVQLQVADTGCGMTPETQARVFDPFFTTKAAGHGLGLAVVQGIVRGLGGNIHIESAAGKGSTFHILLPGVEPLAQAAPSTISRTEEQNLRSGEATVLLVEDETSLRVAVTKMLRKKGFSVFEASDGSAALDLIRGHKNHIDVLLLDVTLPGVTSGEVLVEAKRLRPRMTAIVTSAHSRDVAAASLGGTIEHFIRKPFRVGDLIDMIREASSS